MQAPNCHVAPPTMGGMELRLAAAWTLVAKRTQFSTIRNALGRRPEALEDSAIAEAHCVIDEFFVVPIVAFRIGCEALGYMRDAANDRRVVEHVDDRSMHVGDGHLRLMPPDILRAEDLSIVDVLPRKERALSLLALLTHRLCGHHEDIFGDLFG